jgi:hypothetical protein
MKAATRRRINHRERREHRDERGSDLRSGNPFFSGLCALCALCGEKSGEIP